MRSLLVGAFIVQRIELMASGVKNNQNNIFIFKNFRTAGNVFYLKYFAENLRNVNILLRVDNTTALSYINLKGRIKFSHLRKLARKIWIDVSKYICVYMHLRAPSPCTPTLQCH